MGSMHLPFAVTALSIYSSVRIRASHGFRGPPPPPRLHPLPPCPPYTAPALLAMLRTHQVPTGLRAFALAVLPTRNAFLGVHRVQL